MDLFILSGQSNMAGRGGVNSGQWDGIVPSDCQYEPGAIFRLNAGMDWEEAHEPLHADIDSAKTCGLGPGLVFAAEVRRRCAGAAHLSFSEKMGLIPCAIGGTAIDEWERQGALYQAMVARTRAALQGGGTLRALLWYQGESDTGSAELAESYTGKMEALVHNLRADLQHPDLPVIQVGITTGDLPTTRYLRRLREAQRAVQVPGVFFVDALGLALQADLLHLTTQSQVQLGRQLASHYMEEILPHFVT